MAFASPGIWTNQFRSAANKPSLCAFAIANESTGQVFNQSLGRFKARSAKLARSTWSDKIEGAAHDLTGVGAFRAVSTHPGLANSVSRHGRLVA